MNKTTLLIFLNEHFFNNKIVIDMKNHTIFKLHQYTIGSHDHIINGQEVLFFQHHINTISHFGIRKYSSRERPSIKIFL